MRTYFTAKTGKKRVAVSAHERSEYEWWEEPNLTSLAKTVYEEEELIDTGIIDEAGDKIMAKERKDRIGFVRFPEKS